MLEFADYFNMAPTTVYDIYTWYRCFMAGIAIIFPQILKYNFKLIFFIDPWEPRE